MKSQSEWDWTEPYKAWEAWSRGGGVEEDAESSLSRGTTGSQLPARLCMGCRQLDRSEERRVFEMATSEKLRWCAVFRGRGEALAREGQAFRASLWYRKSLAYYEYTFPEDECGVIEMDATRFGVLLGLARCDARHRLFRQVVGHCREALQLNPKHDGVLALRAAALVELDEYDAAGADLERVLEHDRHHVAARRVAARLAQRRRAYLDRSKKQATRVLNGLGDRRRPSSGPQPADRNPNTTTAHAMEQVHYRKLLRDARAVVPRSLSARDRDKLDDLYAPVDAVSPLLSALQRRLAQDRRPAPRHSASSILTPPQAGSS